MFKLKVDEEVLGWINKIGNISDLKSQVLEELDENVVEVIIKKKDPVDSIKTLYIIERKSSDYEIKDIKKYLKAQRKKGKIDIKKYEALQKRLQEKWIIEYADSYSINLNDITTVFMKEVRNHPGEKYRIAKVECVCSEYGIALEDIDYKRIEIIKPVMAIVKLIFTKRAI